MFQKVHAKVPETALARPFFSPSQCYKTLRNLLILLAPARFQSSLAAPFYLIEIFAEIGLQEHSPVRTLQAMMYRVLQGATLFNRSRR
ncbi:MAG: hypothetical protein KL840_14200 [Aquamicrobium sp.]|nr:hypothetical protein [Aquamicrobium sp.]